ncbi:unnamed protein product [Caenorhabditis sp. 36 PRJEB53466]|nr:unnamed protein product [Caenorhabditis sp. 36 PRJEB53466]
MSMAWVATAKRPKNPAFVPDQRCSGWWVATIVEYTGNGPQAETIMLYKVRDALKVYSRYRVYYYELHHLVISVREEDVDHVSDALYNYRLIPPRPEHLENDKIFWENAPIYTDLYDILNDFMFRFNVRKLLDLKNTANPAERVDYNLAHDMLEHLAKRLILDIPVPSHRDYLLKRISTIQYLNENAEKSYKMWIGFKNLGELRKKIDDMCNRPKKERLPLDKYFKITQTEFNTFHTKYPHLLIDNEKLEDEDIIDERVDYTDNTMINNNDVIKHRGLYLSGSTTYPEWDAKANRQCTHAADSAGQSTSSSAPSTSSAVPSTSSAAPSTSSAAN